MEIASQHDLVNVGKKKKKIRTGIHVLQFGILPKTHMPIWSARLDYVPARVLLLLFGSVRFYWREIKMKFQKWFVRGKWNRKFVLRFISVLLFSLALVVIEMFFFFCLRFVSKRVCASRTHTHDHRTELSISASHDTLFDFNCARSFSPRRFVKYFLWAQLCARINSTHSTLYNVADDKRNTKFEMTNEKGKTCPRYCVVERGRRTHAYHARRCVHRIHWSIYNSIYRYKSKNYIKKNNLTDTHTQTI